MSTDQHDENISKKMKRKLRRFLIYEILMGLLLVIAAVAVAIYLRSN